MLYQRGVSLRALSRRSLSTCFIKAEFLYMLYQRGVFTLTMLVTTFLLRTSQLLNDKNNRPILQHDSSFS